MRGRLAGLTDDPELRKQVGNTVPPRAPLVVDGIPRHSSRGVAVDQALAFSARGMRHFLFSFDLCCELSEELFGELVEAERELLDDDGSYEAMESDLSVYGRHRGAEDTRVVGTVLARHVLRED